MDPEPRTASRAGPPCLYRHGGDGMSDGGIVMDAFSQRSGAVGLERSGSTRP